MAQIQITFTDKQIAGKDVKVIIFNGQLDEMNVDTEAQKIYKMITEIPQPNLLLDFGDLTYMNSKSIGYVTDWYSKTAEKNGKIAIVRPRPNIMDILKVVGISQIVNIFDSMEDAETGFFAEGYSGESEPEPVSTPMSEIAPISAPASTAPTTPAEPTPLSAEAPTGTPAPAALTETEPKISPDTPPAPPSA